MHKRRTENLLARLSWGRCRFRVGSFFEIGHQNIWSRGHCSFLVLRKLERFGSRRGAKHSSFHIPQNAEKSRCGSLSAFALGRTKNTQASTFHQIRKRLDFDEIVDSGPKHWRFGRKPEPLPSSIWPTGRSSPVFCEFKTFFMRKFGKNGPTGRDEVTFWPKIGAALL